MRSRVKKPWVWRTLPAPPQVGQVFGLVPALAPEPEQASQVTEVGMRTCAVLPAIGLLERDLHVVAQVRAALAPAAAAPPAAHAEQVFEDVREGRGEVGAEAVALPAAALLERRVAEAVIGGALLPVLQDVIGLVDLLELVLAFLVAGIAVGVPLHRELAIGGLESRRRSRCATTLENFVIVALGHAFSCRP